jgi:hypothetical protein
MQTFEESAPGARITVSKTVNANNHGDLSYVIHSLGGARAQVVWRLKIR